MNSKAFVVATLAAMLSFGVTLHAGEGKKCEGGKCDANKVAQSSDKKSDKKADEKQAETAADKSGEETQKKDAKKAS